MEKVGVVVILIVSMVVLFILSWQRNLGRQGIACGGDFSYNVKCPIGTMCKTQEGDNELKGGMCTPWLQPGFDLFFPESK